MKRIFTVILLTLLLTGCEKEDNTDKVMELYAYVNQLEINEDIISYDIYNIDNDKNVSYFEISRWIDDYTWESETLYYYCDMKDCTEIDKQEYIIYRSDTYE